MEHDSFDLGTCAVQFSAFAHDGGSQCAMLLCSRGQLPLPGQLDDIFRGLQQGLLIKGLEAGHLRFSRFYVSDILNQESSIKESKLYRFLAGVSCVSIIQQPPLTGSKVCLFIRMTQAPGMEKTIRDNVLVARDQDHAFMWTSDFELPAGTSTRQQTRSLLELLDGVLGQHSASLAGNCARTWFYISGIDTNYQAMVEARNEYFAQVGLLPSTHFIASTGIEGKTSPVSRTVAMESYSVLSIAPGNMQYLNVPQFMNSTHEYGVAFERATSVDLGGYHQILVSGTASIDNRGEILFPNEVENQLDRAMMNIGALLDQAGACLEDVLYFIVYLRDLNDAAAVEALLRGKCPCTPVLLVQAPVCRPGWLIELECEALRLS